MVAIRKELVQTVGLSTILELAYCTEEMSVKSAFGVVQADLYCYTKAV